MGEPPVGYIIIVLTGQDRNYTPYRHTNRQVDGRFSDIVQEHVPTNKKACILYQLTKCYHLRWHLHDDIADIENRQDGSELRAMQPEVPFKAS